MREVVVVSGVRTPIGNYLGVLADYNAVTLGKIALEGALNKIGLDKTLVEEVIAGHVNQAGSPGNSARHIALAAELPVNSFACTVHQQCASSMRAAELIAQEIMLGKIDVGAAVGVESMSTAPYLLFGARKGYRLGDGEQIQDSLMIGGLVVCRCIGYQYGCHRGKYRRDVWDHAGRTRRVCTLESSACLSGNKGRMVSGGDRSRGNKDQEGNRDL